uniref:Uncharacterized protein n=1 Tax=Rhizophora mucronata TaxID=61149 RepID=A0A2P2PCH6_RHIMU
MTQTHKPQLFFFFCSVILNPKQIKKTIKTALNQEQQSQK